MPSVGSSTDHPRVRGEHTLRELHRKRQDGSSPRARGTPVAADPQLFCMRIIPACAGNTRLPARKSRVRADHPRVRGEHEEIYGVGQAPYGSSPRARGTRLTMDIAGLRVRIIPACAGNTSAARWNITAESDHPRVRGEHLLGSGCLTHTDGSSPRARGTPVFEQRLDSLDRIIPACAGNTRRRHGPRTPQTDHPRVRGEHSLKLCHVCPSGGSSPRARGTPCGGADQGRRDRIIPACAGNTRVSDGAIAI